MPRQKAIVIGIGGTGLQTIRDLRKLIAERYELGLQAEEVSSLKFLYIDTHNLDVLNTSWSILEKDISLTEGEKLIFVSNKLRPVVDRPEDYPAFGNWLPDIGNYVGEPGHGAKAIRAYGRLIYEYPENRNLFRQRIEAVTDSLNRAFRDITEWRFYLACGLSGGTGSGMFLPVSKDMRKWNIFQTGIQELKFYSFLVLPSQAKAPAHERYYPNTYAALKELNYYATLPLTNIESLPFNNCYLVEPVNAANVSVTLEDMPLLIAQRIFLSIQGGEGAQYVDMIMDNNTALNDGVSDGHAQRFSTFGISTVNYPREAAAKCVTYHLVNNAISEWLEANSASYLNMNEKTRNLLDKLLLSRRYLVGDSDPFQQQDEQDFEVEIKGLVDRAMQDAVKKNLANKAQTTYIEIEDSYRNKGIEAFYKQKNDDLNGALEKSISLVSLQVSEFITGGKDYGIQYAKSFLEELLKILEENREEIRDEKATFEKKLITTQNNLSKAINEIATKESSFGYMGWGFKADSASVSDDLQKYLVNKAGAAAYKYALGFLEKAIPRIEEINQSLKDWEDKLSETGKQLYAKLRKSLKDLQSGSVGNSEGGRENGIAVFSETKLNKIVLQLNPTEFPKELVQAIANHMGKGELSDITWLAKLDTIEVQKIVYESAYKLVVDCLSSDSHSTICDKLLEEHTRSQDRQRVLSTVKQLSGSFLQFSTSEIIKGTTRQTQTAITIPRQAGIVPQNAVQSREVVEEDLKAMGEYDFKFAEDKERITFLTEDQAFPLRLIDSLARIKDFYNSYPNKDALHIDKTLLTKLYKLYHLSAEEKSQILEAEEVFTIARACEWMKLTKDEYTHKKQIFYYLSDENAVGVEPLAIGKDWNKVFDDFLEDVTSVLPKNDNLRRSREHATKRFRYLRKEEWSNPEKAETMRSKLEEHFDCIAKELDGGPYNPLYKYNKGIVDRIINSLDFD